MNAIQKAIDALEGARKEFWDDWHSEMSEEVFLSEPTVEDIDEAITALRGIEAVDVETIKASIRAWRYPNGHSGVSDKEYMAAHLVDESLLDHLHATGYLPPHNQWQDISTAPRDGTWFLGLIEGIPYQVKAFMNGDKVNYHWRMHSNMAVGQTLRVEKDEDGNEKRVQIKEADEPRFEPVTLGFKLGMNHIPTHWMPLPKPPKNTQGDRNDEL